MHMDVDPTPPMLMAAIAHHAQERSLGWEEMMWRKRSDGKDEVTRDRGINLAACVRLRKGRICCACRFSCGPKSCLKLVAHFLWDKFQITEYHFFYGWTNKIVILVVTCIPYGRSGSQKNHTRSDWTWFTDWWAFKKNTNWCISHCCMLCSKPSLEGLGFQSSTLIRETLVH